MGGKIVLVLLNHPGLVVKILAPHALEDGRVFQTALGMSDLGACPVLSAG